MSEANAEFEAEEEGEEGAETALVRTTGRGFSTHHTPRAATLSLNSSSR